MFGWIPVVILWETDMWFRNAVLVTGAIVLAVFAP